MQKKLPLVIERMIKIFLVGLLVQFFLQTFVTYQLEWTGSFWTAIWLWKEVFILIFIICIGIGVLSLTKKEGSKRSWSIVRKSDLFRFIVYFVVGVVVSFILAVGIQKLGIGTYILSFKYDFLGFLIFLIGVGLARMFPISAFHKRYQKILKIVVWGAFFRWGLIYLMPNGLKFFGYSHFNYEGTLEDRPPAVYYTQINQGAVRNQFLFERPISFGFFLIAFWPLFAAGYLRKQSRRNQIFWTVAFGALVFSTLSRAAIGVRLFETALLAVLIHRKHAKKLVLFVGIPGALLLLVGLWHFRGIFAREHSNTGHAVLLQEGIKLGMESPFFGRGAGYSGPASHQLCFNAPENPRCQTIQTINERYEISTHGYNPENQYVQIFMEYGLVGLIPRLLCFTWLIWTGLKTLKPLIIELKKSKKPDQQKISQLFILFAFGLGMFGLALEGLVLHSFVDRMIVYPFMLLFGLWYGQTNKEKLGLEDNHTP